MNRLALERYLSNNPLPRGSGVRVDKIGLPLLLGSSLRQGLSRFEPRSIRASMTALSLSRKELGGSEIDLKPITESSYARSDTVDLVSKMIPEFLDHFNIKQYNVPHSTLTESDYSRGLTKDEWLSSTPFHFTTKSGPNGPALQSSLIDYLGLPSKLKEALIVLEPRLKPIFSVLDSQEIDLKN